MSLDDYEDHLRFGPMPTASLKRAYPLFIEADTPDAGRVLQREPRPARAEEITADALARYVRFTFPAWLRYAGRDALGAPRARRRSPREQSLARAPARATPARRSSRRAGRRIAVSPCRGRPRPDAPATRARRRAAAPGGGARRRAVAARARVRGREAPLASSSGLLGPSPASGNPRRRREVARGARGDPAVTRRSGRGVRATPAVERATSRGWSRTSSPPRSPCPRAIRPSS